ncbi:MAG TPA: isoprenylcysteine carboxylmethyltransferase family protein [Thermohalobaculum sp.]|nr:isoprenylcysteine carboxylmethyltransferase family protein [Thermohalobaculum sp.]
MSEAEVPERPSAPDVLPRAVRQAPPASAVETWQSWTGVAGFALALVLLRIRELALVDAFVLIGVLTALPIIVLEARKSRGSARLVHPFDAAHAERVMAKLAGLGLTFALIALAYWAIPYYRDGPATILRELLGRPYVAVSLAVLAPVYLSLTDRTMAEPEDTLYRVGRRLFGIAEPVDAPALRQFVLGWIVKAFFLPLMILFTIDYVRWWYRVDLAGVWTGYFSVYEFLYEMVFFVEVTFAAVGYVLTLRLLGTHIRSSEPTTLGWLVAVLCYPPFWTGVFATMILAYDADGRSWGDFFGGVPVLAHLWAAVLLALVAVYASATVQFGIRFSNLTHRGILTNGPYRWSKHPAYITKNISWWMLSVPFLSQEGPAEAFRLSLLLAGVNVIYYLRAKTEERHLARDPVYRDYMAFMARHALLAVVRRRLLAPLRAPGRGAG